MGNVRRERFRGDKCKHPSAHEHRRDGRRPFISIGCFTNDPVKSQSIFYVDELKLLGSHPGCDWISSPNGVQFSLRLPWAPSSGHVCYWLLVNDRGRGSKKDTSVWSKQSCEMARRWQHRPDADQKPKGS